MLKRIVPVLLLSGKGLVKTQRFQSPKYVGDAINAVKIFSEKEVDEIVFLDIEASKQNREPDYDLIKSIASEAYMPFAYGGGIKTLEQAEKILSNGAEKIIINRSFFSNPKMISEMIQSFGSQSVAICIDVKKDMFGRHRVYHYFNKKKSSTSLTDFIKHCEAFGFGEIIIQNVDRDGMMKGYDLDLIKLSRLNTELPLVAVGGAGEYDDIQKAFDSGADAAAAGSLFTFYGKYRAVLINYPDNTIIKRIVDANMY